MKTALVTGASSGIGWEIAKLLGEQGHHLILVARSEDKLLELKKLLQNTPITIDIIPLDLSLATAPQTLFEKVNSLGRTVDILVNNAGFGEAGAFSDIDLKRQADMIQVNVTTLTALTHLFLPAMKEKRSGHIVNIASTAAFQPGPYMAVYFATKAYVLLLSEALSEELCESGVYVTAICPGATHSGFQKAAHLTTAHLFRRGGIPSSLEVARFTLKAMEKHKVIAIHGLMNKLMVWSLRLTPRFLARKVAKLLVKNA
ncbi:MAG: SDR family oxidoreductase [Bdellovibrionaceae bacterium]|nr:SDR family oxidoreductase [Pseudobdellovibrionaceae bacterium]